MEQQVLAQGSRAEAADGRAHEVAEDCGPLSRHGGPGPAPGSLQLVPSVPLGTGATGPLEHETISSEDSSPLEKGCVSPIKCLRRQKASAHSEPPSIVEEQKFKKKH